MSTTNSVLMRAIENPPTRYHSMELGAMAAEEDVAAEETTHQKFGFTLPVHVQVAMLLFFIGMLAVAGYISFVIAGTDNSCLGKPYLYITHHDSHTVLKFTRDGCALSPNILWYGTTGRSNSPIPSSFRGIFIHPFNGIKDALFIANAGEASDDNARVLVFDTCSSINGQRPYLTTLVSAKNTPGAEHTYMLGFDEDHHMYASFQHSDAVFRFRCHNSSCVPATGTHLEETFINDVAAKGDALHVRPQPGQVSLPQPG